MSNSYPTPCKKRYFLLFLLLCPVFFTPAPVPAQIAAETAAPADPDPETSTADEEFDFANGLYARDMFDMAAPEYEKLINRYPAHPQIPDTYYRYGESLFLTGQYEQALSVLETFIERYPDHPRRDMARLRMAEAYLNTGRAKEAQAHLDDLIEADVPFVQQSARYFSGKTAYERNEWKKAAEHFRTLIDSRGGNPYWEIARYHLGKTAFRQGDPETAEDHYESMLSSEKREMTALAEFGLGQVAFERENFETSAEHFRKAHKTAESESVREDAFINYLKALYETGSYEDVVTSYDQSALANPEKMYPFKLVAANSLFKLKEFDRTIRLFEEILRLPDLSAEQREIAELGKIESLLAAERAAEAVAASNEMLQERTFFRDRWAYLMAEALKRAGHEQEALGIYETFLEHFPDSRYRPRVLLGRAHLLLDLGNPEEAKTGFDNFLRNYSDHPLAKQTLLNRISLDVQLDSWEDAITSSRAFLEKFGNEPEAPEVLSRLGSLYLQVKDFDRAFETYETYLENQAPGEDEKQEIMFFMGYSRQLAGNLDEAVEYYRDIDFSRLSPDMRYTALKNLAYSLVRLDRLDEATAVYRDMIQAFPDRDLNTDVYFWLADFYSNAEDSDSLFSVLQGMRNANLPEEEQAALHYYTGEAYRLSEQPEKAVEAYQGCLAAPCPQKAAAHLGKALALDALGDKDKAEAELEAAIKTAADDHGIAMKARMKLAELHEEGERFAEAAKAYLSVAILYQDKENVPVALYRAGRAFEQAGENGKAESAFGELREKYPDHPLSAEAVPAPPSEGTP